MSYSSLAIEDAAAAIHASADIQAFTEIFNAAFGGFSEHLRGQLIAPLRNMCITVTEDSISEYIFDRLSSIPLIDRYEAFQLLDDRWAVISSDLEILRPEGFDAVRVVDPHMVLKKKNNTEEEVQEGWVGRVIPFELVQETLLSERLTALRAHEDRLSEISAEYEEALDSLSEEDKGQDFVNEDGTAFVWAEVKKAIKAGDFDPETLDVLRRALALNDEEKALKKTVKDETAQLHQATKDTIEALDDEQALVLLESKWITPLVEALGGLPVAVVDTLAKKVTALADKYTVTLHDLEDDISRTQKELCVMLDELTGSEADMKGMAELKSLLRG